MIGEHLDIYTYEYILSRALSHVSNEVDKREGEVIFDAIAPACKEIAKVIEEMKVIYKNTFAETAEGEYLDKRAAEVGLTRKSATYAVRRGYFYTNNDIPFDIPIGSRFATANGKDSITFVATQQLGTGIYKLTAETPGTEGNRYVGDLLPITNVNNLTNATISDILIPGQPVQTDVSLRTEYFDILKQRAFGGNIAHYRSEITDIDGVGAVQVYPVWNGGGTVKCSIITSEYRSAAPALVNDVKVVVDPTDGEGMGLAPIGHHVTITTATEKVINISADITTVSGINPSLVLPLVGAEIESYFLQTRQDWGIADNQNNYSLYIFASQVTAAILRVNGVLNVSNLTLNGQSFDIVLTQNSTLQELPVLGGGYSCVN